MALARKAYVAKRIRMGIPKLGQGSLKPSTLGKSPAVPPKASGTYGFIQEPKAKL